MTDVYITIDTEYSAGIYAREGFGCRQNNFDRSIAGFTPAGAVGIGYQMDVFDRYDLKAVFFVDPMPALVWGVDSIADIVGPIIERGHDVQLHLHTEWLEFAGEKNPIGNRTGQNIKQFSLSEQYALLDYAQSTLMSAGAPKPVAFRAGNYGANDDTLRALAKLGIAYETSHCPGIAGSLCDISLGSNDRCPVIHHGVLEVPIGSIASFKGAQRHAQITALSADELIAAIKFDDANQYGPFTLVSHSFELLSRDRSRINHIVKRRFEKFCRKLAKLKGVKTATYSASPPSAHQPNINKPILPHNFIRTGFRLSEQVLGNALYGAG
jgi:peptidoglycan/xylan/chitin deacetylase (PgdA/CDA1 family)